MKKLNRNMRTKCPKCGGGLAVKKTYNKAGSVIIRTRCCRECGQILCTVERIIAVQETLLGK